jgi:type 1 glutamine amidotransferase
MAGDGPAPRKALSALVATATAVVVVVLALAGCGGSSRASKASSALNSSTSTATGSAARAGAKASGVRTVLVLTQTLGYHHASIPAAEAALRRIAARDRRYRLTFLPSATQLTPQALAHASAVVFLLTAGTLPLTPTDKRALVAFVHRGGGLLGFHSATDTFHHWPAYIRLMGAEFSHHPHPSTQRVTVIDGSTPMTRALPKAFSIHEEFYVFSHDPLSRLHVLARLDGRVDHPLVWCRRAERGRVFYDALGHFAQTWGNPLQIAMATGGIAWATGLATAPSCG